MATLTINVDPETLSRAREKAAALHTSVERILEDSIASLAADANDQVATINALEAWAAAHPFTVDVSSYAREDLNQR